METLSQLAIRWREEATLLERYGDWRGATVARLHAEELERAVAEMADEALTLSEAAAESGYSERRLRELIAEGTVENVGRKHAPRLRRANLPRKPRSAPGGQFNASTAAASILSRMKVG